ncbi:GNAT family N-acetyltransferase [Chromatiaceae bacterium AAb-1]|nr:GNAT family N-acetyltransferase [Chromatiaceae bacterium AAb-1]
MTTDTVRWTVCPLSASTEWPAIWQTLHLATGNHLLLDYRFISTAIAAFPPADGLIAIARKKGLPVAISVLEKTGFGRWQTYQPSQAPLGAWLQLPEQDITRLLATLAQALPFPVLTISLTQQDPDLIPRPADTPKLITSDYITTGRLTLNMPFADYWNQRSKNTRQNVNKISNRLQKELLIPQFSQLKDPSMLAAAVNGYATIESASWKQQHGTAVSMDNAQGHFYLNMLQQFAPAQAEVWQYHYNQQLVATDLCIRDADTLIILKTTYDEEWSRFSPAFAMHVDGIQYCMDQGLRQIEFYGPAMEWHRKLTDELRTLYHITWYAFSLLRKLATLRRSSSG